MRHILRLMLATALLVLAGVAMAGSVEDGYAAYEQGNYADALQLWQPLANRGVTDAQEALGMMYFEGTGVPLDYVQAHMWYDLAAKRGDQAALTDLELVAAKMTPDQIAAAERLASEWKPKPLGTPSP